MYVLVAHKHFEEACRECGISERVRALCAEIKQAIPPATPYVPRFSPLIGLWRIHPMGQYTLVARYTQWSEGGRDRFAVVCLLDVQEKPANEVKERATQVVEALERRFQECLNLIPPAVARAKSEGKTATTLAQVQDLPPELEDWPRLLSTKGPDQKWYIFESEAWTRRLAELPQSVWEPLRSVLENAADRAAKGRTRPSELESAAIDGWRAYYGLVQDRVLCWALVPESARKAREPEIQREWEQLCREVDEALNPGLTDAHLAVSDVLGKRFVRAYDAIVLADDQWWRWTVDMARWHTSPTSSIAPAMRYQQLALSMEELTLLHDLLAARELPCFLEGRAGSGKSTVLFYFMAFLAAAFPEELLNHGRIGFITHSGLLKDLARHAVRFLVKAEQGPGNGGAAETSLNFATFAELCLRMLPPERRARYADLSARGQSRRIDAVRFRQLYSVPGLRHGFMGQRVVPWQVAWHVIRTYIKGWKTDERGQWMDPDEYDSLVPAKQRTVTLQQYRKVYEHVWPWYSRLTNADDPDAFWDDTDLARAVVSEPTPPDDAPSFFALLCDEAQDFAVVEVLALLRALRWSAYDLSPLLQDGSCPIPLLLAGDPMQTVNPAGFRWGCAHRVVQDGLSSSLHSEAHIPIRHRTLTYNYRNPKDLARGANAIQLARAKLFDDGYTSIVPQRIWRTDETCPVQLKTWNDPEELVEVLKNCPLVIVPHDRYAAENGPSDLSAVLAPYAERLRSPADVKGAEFDHVVLLNFGQSFFEQRLASIWDKPFPLEPDRPETMVAQHFFNSLYVAFTRATKELLIVDTEEGLQHFWQPLREFARKHCSGRWEGLTELTWTEPIVWPPARVTANELQTAHRLWEVAQADKDPGLARLAAAIYDRLGEWEAATRCRAYADYWDGQVEQAADRLVQLPGELEQACEWYWEVGAWQKLSEHRARLLERRRWKQRFDVIDELARSQIDLQAVRRLMTALRPVVQQVGSLVTDPSWHGWKAVFDQTIAAVHIVKDAASPDELERWLTLLSGLSRAAFPLNQRHASQLFEIAYRAATRHGLPHHARELFAMAKHYAEHAGRTKERDYHHAAAEVADFPRNVEKFVTADLPERAVKAWEASGANFLQMPGDIQSAIVTAYERTDRPSKALSYALCYDADRAFDLLVSAQAHRELRRGIRHCLETCLAICQEFHTTSRDAEQRFATQAVRLLELLLGRGRAGGGRHAPRRRRQALDEGPRRRWIHDLLIVLNALGNWAYDAARGGNEARIDRLFSELRRYAGDLCRLAAADQPAQNQAALFATAVHAWLFAGELYLTFPHDEAKPAARSFAGLSLIPPLERRSRELFAWLKLARDIEALREKIAVSGQLAKYARLIPKRATQVFAWCEEELGRMHPSEPIDSSPPEHWLDLLQVAGGLLDPEARLRFAKTMAECAEQSYARGTSRIVRVYQDWSIQASSEQLELARAVELNERNPHAEHADVLIRINRTKAELSVVRRDDFRGAYFSLDHLGFTRDSALKTRTIQPGVAWEVQLHTEPDRAADKVVRLRVRTPDRRWLIIEFEGQLWRVRLPAVGSR